jgi:hypothetical protein
MMTKMESEASVVTFFDSTEVLFDGKLRALLSELCLLADV